MQADYDWYVGIDWGDERHRVCVLRPDGAVEREEWVEHDGAKLRACADRLVELAQGKAERIAVGIETPRGAVVATMLERGMSVFALNPKQLDRFRDRHTVAGAKDDRRDAFVIGDSLRNDLVLFRRVKLGEPLLVELRELTRMHEDLVAERVGLGNRLRDQLQRFYPQLVSLGSVHDERWLWALLKRAPTPEQGARLSLAKIASILKTHHIRRLSAEQVRDALRREPLRVAPGVREASILHVTTLLPRLELADQQRRDTLRAMEELLDRIENEGERKEHRDARILRSLPGVGTIVCATMLAEAWEPLVERDYRRLRANCGVAPVTKQSGKSLQVTRRRACNHRLVDAVFHWAATAVRLDPKAGLQYRRLRAAGHSHGRALRGVADRLLAVLTAMLRRNVTYDPQLRLAA